MKSTLKRFLSLVLCMCMVMALLPNVTMTAFAATSGTVTGLTDENIGLSFEGDADDAWSANGTSIIGAATSTGGTCSDTQHSSTLTITNKKSTTATLSFDYTIEQNSGTIQVDGTVVSSGASFTKELAANESVKVYIKSGSTSAATKITLTNVVLVSDVNATATFVPAENGTYTVDGKLITEEYSNTQSSMTAYQVVATPADGYQFMGWYDVSNEKYISTSAKAALNIENDCTITARFASKTAALFETGGQRFADLNEAVVYAQANGQSKITLATNGSISGTYTIPTGITLLIPFDEAGTLYTDAPAAIRTTPESKPFRTLTMSEGTSITVNGAISLGGRYFAAGGGQQGRPVGDYGYIKMADNSSITVKNGGKLYAWGFISGSGSVLAESGATVYEFYQIADFRGGSASSGMGHGVFPFSQYFVQNIEVPLTLNAGANEQVYSGVFAMSTTYTTAINFIGDNGMFKVESGSFTKDYDEKTDRLVFTVNGEAALNTLSLTLASMDVDSASYVLPITNNITINIQSGNVTINQDAALLAGVEVNIAEGAGLTVANGKNIYFYDSDEWNSDNFVWGPCKFKSVAYAPGKAYNRSNNDLVDAKMNVNGSVTAIGAIYTTKGGANICSRNGTGKYIQQGTPGTETETYQYNAGSNAVTIPITAAKLHNADGSYADTKGKNSGTTFYYSNGVWGTAKPCDHKNTEIRNAKDATCTEDGYTGDTYCSVCNEPLKQGKKIPKTGAHITWVIDGKIVAEKDYLKGTMPSFEGSTDKAPDENYRYTFTGWSPEVVVAEEDATYTARYSATARVFYTITFNANGGEGSMEPQRFEVGVDTALNINAFTRENYKFNGWNTAADGSGATYADAGAILELTGDMTLYAQWQIWNGWFTDVNGKQYYQNGVLQKTGWTVIDGNTYYLDTETGYAATGITTLVPNGATEEARCVFDANGVFQSNVTGVYSVGNDTYWLNSGIIEEEAGLKRVVKEDGEVNYYYFGEDSKACKATAEKNQYLVEKTNGLALPGGINYTFGEDGVIAHFADTSIRGIYFDESSSNYYYCIDGVIIANGLMLIDGSYYYARTSSGAFVCGRSYWITKTNGLLDAGIYTFDDAGKIIFPEKPKNGIVAENGSLYYYVDGVLTGAGLIQIGNDYYYVRTSTGEVVHGRSYWVTDTNDLLPAGPYTFDTDGKMINPPVVDPNPDPDPTPDVKNGIVAENGSLYYYENGVLTGAGLIQLNGDYYYVKTSNCEVVHGRSYWITVTNGLLPTGQYMFADNGKLIR